MDCVVSPWAWIPNPGPWMDSLMEPAETWVPDRSLRVDARAIIEAIARAIDERAPWLRHPCLARRTLRRTSER
jgi:hypothetical protein